MEAETATEGHVSASLQNSTPTEPFEVVKKDVVEPPSQKEGSMEAIVEGDEKAEEKKNEEASDTIPVPTVVEPAPSFKEESYYVKDLRDSEKKALEALKAKIEEAIKTNTFLEPPKAKEPPVEEENKSKEEVAASKVGTHAEQATRVEPVDSTSAKCGDEEAPVVGTSTVDKEEEVEVPKVETDTQKTTEAESVEFTPANSGGEEVPVEITPRENDLDLKEEVSIQIMTPNEKKEEAPVNKDDGPSLEDLLLWGIPLLPSKGDERTNVVLLKFLRAQDFDVKDSMNMLRDTMTWRKEFNMDSLMEEEIMASEFESIAYVHGVDKIGRPVCYNCELVHKSFDDEEHVNKFIKWRVQMLEKDIQKLDFNADGVHSLLQVVDFKHLPGLLYRKSLTKKVLSLLQDNYPELIAKQIYINVPWYFGAIYMLHGKMLTPRSKSKVVLVRPGKVTEALFKYISPENVPVEYGGLSRPNDTEFDDVHAPVNEVIVKAGDKKVVELEVDEAGSTVVWDFMCLGWELVYGEEFVPKDETGYTVIIRKAKKMGSGEEPVRNSFRATEPGKVVITLDNTTSRRKKLAIYRHTIKLAT